MTVKPTCTVDGCEALHSARGYCRSHYAKLWLAERPTVECKAEGCTRKGNGPGCARGYCGKHYHRVNKHGSANGGRVLSGSFEERLWRLVEKDSTTGCWNWIGSINHQGYGRFTLKGRPQMAHRATYTHFKGAIPEGLTMDHLCNNRACVNPDHLEPVTHTENNRRRDERMKARDEGKKQKRLKLPYLMTLAEFTAWAEANNYDLNEVRISHGFVMTP